MLVASITDPLVQFAVDVIDKMGLIGVFLLMVGESALLPIPSEGTMLFAGFNVAEGEYSLLVVTAVGVAANVVGSWIAYGIGYFGRVDLIEKHGKRLHVSPAKLQTADRWFARHGEATVFFGRMIPVVRAFVSLPAGVARMPLRRFIPFTVLGSAPWLLAWALAGRAAGDNWRHYRHYVGYLDYAVLAAAIAGIVYLVLRRRNRRADVETVT